MKTIHIILLVATLTMISSTTNAQKNVEEIDSICKIINSRGGNLHQIEMKGILGNDMSNSATFYSIDSVQKQIRKASCMRKSNTFINFYYENNSLIKVEETKDNRNGYKILRSYYFHNKILIQKKGNHKKFKETNYFQLQADSLLNDSIMIYYFNISGIILSLKSTNFNKVLMSDHLYYIV